MPNSSLDPNLELVGDVQFINWITRLSAILEQWIFVGLLFVSHRRHQMMEQKISYLGHLYEEIGTLGSQ